jgi:hypothetical protein
MGFDGGEAVVEVDLLGQVLNVALEHRDLQVRGAERVTEIMRGLPLLLLTA